MGHAFRSPSHILVASVTVAAMVCLGGCGRKGPLELPAASPPSQAEASAAAARQARVLQNGDTPGLIQSPNQFVEETAAAKQQVFVAGPAPRAINAPPETRPSRFILDPLL